MIFFQNNQNVNDDSFKKDLELFKEYQAQAGKPENNSFIFALLFFWMPCILWVLKMYVFPGSEQMAGLYSFYLFFYTVGVALVILAVLFNSQTQVLNIFIKTATERFDKNVKISVNHNINIISLIKYFFAPSCLPFMFMFYVYLSEDKPLLFTLCALFITILSYYMYSTMNAVISHVANLWEKKKMEIEKENN